MQVRRERRRAPLVLVEAPRQRPRRSARQRMEDAIAIGAGIAALVFIIVTCAIVTFHMAPRP